MSDQDTERPDPPEHPRQDFSDLVRRVALTPIWRVMVRLLSVMPRVSRATNQNIAAHPGKDMGTPGGYPARILGPDDWAEAITIVPAKPVSENADWIIIPGGELAHAEDPVRALRGLYAAMPAKGGYLIVQYETEQESRREAEDSVDGIIAPWHWWRPKYHTAENPGRDATLCYEAMWEFSAMRDCATDPDDVAALKDWSPRNVVIVEVRPKKASQIAHLPRQQQGVHFPYPQQYPGAAYPQLQGPGLLTRLKRALSEF